MFDFSNYISFTIHGAQDSHSGGMAGWLAHVLSYLETASTKSPGEIFADIMPGIAAMDNIHPLLVHFPIGLLAMFAFIDLAGSLFRLARWREAASWFLYSGSIMAAATVAAGLQAANSVAHGDDVHSFMEQHEHLGISVLVVSSLLSIWRILAKNKIRGGANAVYSFVTIALLVIIGLTADLGGMMVYKYGVAVSTPSPSFLQNTHQHLHQH